MIVQTAWYLYDPEKAVKKLSNCRGVLDIWGAVLDAFNDVTEGAIYIFAATLKRTVNW